MTTETIEQYITDRGDFYEWYGCRIYEVNDGRQCVAGGDDCDQPAVAHIEILGNDDKVLGTSDYCANCPPDERNIHGIRVEFAYLGTEQ